MFKIISRFFRSRGLKERLFKNTICIEELDFGDDKRTGIAENFLTKRVLVEMQIWNSPFGYGYDHLRVSTDVELLQWSEGGKEVEIPIRKGISNYDLQTLIDSLEPGSFMAQS